MKRSSKSLPVIVSPVIVNGTACLRALGRRGAYCVAVSAEKDAPGFRSRFAREKVLLAAETLHAGGFTDWLLSRTDLYGGIVVPTDDTILAELDAHRDALSPRFRLAIPSAPVCAVALDKSALARVAAEAGIPIPKTASHAVELPPEAFEDAAGVGFPAIVKPCFGADFGPAFGKKALVFDSPGPLRDAVAKCRARSIDVIIQELVPGHMASYSAYVTRAGWIAGDFSSRRLGVYPPPFGTGFLEAAEFIGPVMEYGRRLIDCVGYSGALVNLDFAFDPRDGAWKLLDLNARSWRQVSLAEAVGLNVFDFLLADYAGDGPPPPGAGPPEPPRVKYGARWLYLKDALRALRASPKDAPSLRVIAKTLCGPLSCALFDAGDMRPFLADVAPLVLRRFKHHES